MDGSLLAVLLGPSGAASSAARRAAGTHRDDDTNGFADQTPWHGGLPQGFLIRGE